MKRVVSLLLIAVLVVACIVSVVSESEPDIVEGDVAHTSSVTITKKLVGEIWHIRCDYMDGETFQAGGGIWKRDVITNPDGVLSQEGHRSNKCGDDEHWVIWVSSEGVPYRMDEIKSGSTGGTLPTIIYKPRYNLSDEEIRSLDPADEDLVWRYSQNFIDVMDWSEIRIGERMYWTTQNKGQVWYHTGIPYTATPTFMLYVDGVGYPLVAGESVEITDLLPGIHEISEDGSAEYYLGAIDSTGEITDQGEWTVSIILNGDEDIFVNWPNIVITPPPEDSPVPPSPPVVITSTPSPSPSPSPAPSPSPTPLTDIEGRKVWDDENDADGIRPQSITVHLCANGEIVRSVSVKSGDNDVISGVWSYYFSNMPQYDDNGNAIVYTVIEDTVDGYVVHYNGTSIINVHETYSPSPTMTPSPEPTATPTATPTDLPSATPPPSPTPTNPPTDSPTDPPTHTPTPVPTATPSRTPKPTATPTATPVIDELHIPVVPQDQPQPKVPKPPFTKIIEFLEYDTALGINVVINHVGDAFE